MVKQLQFKLVLLLCALVAGVSSAWATDPYYTLNTSSCGSTGNNAYASSGTITVSNIGWYFEGNGTTAPWRLGGKSLNGVDRVAKTTTAMGAAISSINLTVGAASSITVNSLTLIVAYDDEFSDVIDNVAGAFEANSTITFEPTSGSSWAEGAYYKFVFNVTVSGNNNKFVEFKKVDFYEYTGGSSDASSEVAFENETPSISFPATNTYTQAATTATGYPGTVTYEITANTAGATLEGTTLTVTQEGSVTVKATAPAITGWTKTEATYTLTVNDTRSDNGLAYATATQNIVVGEELAAPTLTNPHSLAVTYSSLDETIATVDASGNVTGVAIGSTTIKATFDGNESYKAGSASYTINVTKAPYVIEDGVFDFVEAGSSDPVVDYGSGVTKTSNSNTYVTETKTWTAGNVTMVTGKSSGNGYRWWSNDNTLRFYQGSYATFSVPSGYVITKIVTTGGGFDGANAGALSGNTPSMKWEGVSNEVTLSVTDTGSRNIKTITVTYAENADVNVTSAGLATFACDAALDFSNVAGLEAYIATEGEGDVAIELHKKEKVPAGTGVLLRATDGGDKDYSVPVATGNSDDVTGNLFVRGTGATVESSEGENDNIYSNYILNVVNDELGFYKAAGKTVAKNRAYLHILGGGGNARLSIVFNDEAAGIAEIETMRTVENEKVYNLNGQRVSKATKGLYIINGKKVIRN